MLPLLETRHVYNFLTYFSFPPHWKMLPSLWMCPNHPRITTAYIFLFVRFCNMSHSLLLHWDHYSSTLDKCPGCKMLNVLLMEHPLSLPAAQLSCPHGPSAPWGHSPAIKPLLRRQSGVFLLPSGAEGLLKMSPAFMVQLFVGGCECSEFFGTYFKTVRPSENYRFR